MVHIVPHYFNSRPSARGDRGALRAWARAYSFQFTPLREGRPGVFEPTACGASHFNSRPSARGDASRSSRTSTRAYFNSRPSARGDEMSQQTTANVYNISIHAPPRGATRVLAVSATCSINFNSRPSARGDGKRAEHGRRQDISIHAPPRGATTARIPVSSTSSISIHAPPRGATGQPFEPHSHEHISIHAPPRGATTEVDLSDMSEEISIHAPPRGATGSADRQGRALCHFNSRPSARGDIAARSDFGLYFISIHAPPRGATVLLDQTVKLNLISIHAPPRGATRPSRTAPRTARFQFTPLREGRRSF